MARQAIGFGSRNINQEAAAAVATIGTVDAGFDGLVQALHQAVGFLGIGLADELYKTIVFCRMGVSKTGDLVQTRFKNRQGRVDSVKIPNFLPMKTGAARREFIHKKQNL